MFDDTPRSIRLFEGLSFASVLPRFVTLYADLKADRIPAVPITLIIVILALTLLISRRRKSWARWAFVGLYAILLTALIGSWALAVTWMGFQFYFIPLGITLLQTIAVVLLFTPESSAWFRKRTSFADTFN